MLLVSACLAGIPCRWDGAEKGEDAIIDLVRRGEAVLVCPEQLGGLTTPRSPSELKDGRVISKDGRDVTVEFRRGAEITLAIAKRYSCTEAILKARSPSCGSGQVYDGSFAGRLVPGDGVTAALLKANGIRVWTEEEYLALYASDGSSRPGLLRTRNGASPAPGRTGPGLEVFVETEAGSDVRNRYDESTFALGESFAVAMPYPYAYGFLAGTGAPGLDSLDCYLVTRTKAAAGERLPCRIVGVLEFFENGERDYKFIATRRTENLQVGASLRDELVAFLRVVFSRFEEVEIGFGELLGREAAEALVLERLRLLEGMAGAGAAVEAPADGTLPS
jgi:uncharacterized protein YbbK (DUF523 family)/inorganic pyrophosphatase